MSHCDWPACALFDHGVDATCASNVAHHLTNARMRRQIWFLLSECALCTAFGQITCQDHSRFLKKKICWAKSGKRREKGPRTDCCSLGFNCHDYSTQQQRDHGRKQQSTQSINLTCLNQWNQHILNFSMSRYPTCKKQEQSGVSSSFCFAIFKQTNFGTLAEKKSLYKPVSRPAI